MEPIMYNINVPSYVENETAYIAGANAHIKNNARKGRSKRWFANHEDAQRLYDWLMHSGEFADLVLTKDPEDQDAYETASKALWDNTDLATYDYHHEQYRLDDQFDVHSEVHPMVKNMFAGKFGDFMFGLAEQLQEFGGLSDKQTEVVRKSLARKEQWVADAEEKRAAALEADRKSEFVGELKERRNWVLTINRVINFESQWGLVYINLMKDAAGNVIVGKGTKRYGDEGTTIEVTATVVKHDTRDGVKQTFINRPKIKEAK